MLHTCNSHFPSDNIKNCTALHSPTYPGAVKLNWFPLRTKFLKTLRNQDLHAWSGRLHEFDSLMYQLDIWFTSWLQLSHQSVSLFSLLHSSHNSCVLIYWFSHFISILMNLLDSLSESSVEMHEDDHYHDMNDILVSCLLCWLWSTETGSCAGKSLEHSHEPGGQRHQTNMSMLCCCYVIDWVHYYSIIPYTPLYTPYSPFFICLRVE